MEQEEQALLFARLIGRTAKDMEVLIESLPSEDGPTEMQTNELRRLEEENEEAAKQLGSAVDQGQRLLARLQEALGDVAQTQMAAASLAATSDRQAH